MANNDKDFILAKKPAYKSSYREYEIPPQKIKIVPCRMSSGKAGYLDQQHGLKSVVDKIKL